MKKYLSLFILLLPALSLGQVVWAQNPFMSKNPQKQITQAPVPPNKFLYKIAVWQQQLKQQMSSLARQMKKTGEWGPFFLLIMIAFLYGLIHAAGPGHGKAVALSYIISRGKKYGSALLFGNLIAMLHGFCGIGLVLILQFVLKKRVSDTIENVNRIIQITSYSLIAIIGAVLLFIGLYSWFMQAELKKTDNKTTHEPKKREPFAMILALGMIPCPGVVLVMLFFLSIDLIGLGVVLAFFQTLGMAATMSLVVVIGLTGKRATLSIFENRPKAFENIERIVETTAALFIMVIGLLFLAATV